MVQANRQWDWRVCCCCLESPLTAATCTCTGTNRPCHWRYSWKMEPPVKLASSRVQAFAAGCSVCRPKGKLQLPLAISWQVATAIGDLGPRKLSFHLAIQCLYKLEKKTSVMLCVQNCILVSCWKLSGGVFSQSEFVVYSKLQIVSVGAVLWKLHFSFQKL